MADGEHQKSRNCAIDRFQAHVPFSQAARARALSMARPQQHAAADHPPSVQRPDDVLGRHGGVVSAFCRSRSESRRTTAAPSQAGRRRLEALASSAPDEPSAASTTSTRYAPRSASPRTRRRNRFPFLGRGCSRNASSKATGGPRRRKSVRIGAIPASESHRLGAFHAAG